MKLTEIEMFKGLSNLELSKLLGKMDKLSLAPGAVLFEQGDAGDSMYLIESGEVELFARADGTSHSLARLEEGGSLGEMALLTGETRSATAVASTDSVLYKIDRETFDWLVAEQPGISAYFIRLLSERLIRTNDSLQASKESKVLWIRQQLEQLPDEWVQFLVWCEKLPYISEKLALERFGYNLVSTTSKYPDLLHFLHVENRNENRETEGIRLKSEVRPVLSDYGVEKYGYDRKKTWLEEAAAFYESEGDWQGALALSVELKDFDAFLRAFDLLHSPLTSAEEARLARALKRCPADWLVSRYSVLERVVTSCLNDSRSSEFGLAVIESALGRSGSSYKGAELVALYEGASGFCRILNRKQQAMEYLRLAEEAAGSASKGTAVADTNDERHYSLAKRKLAANRTQFLAAQANRLAESNSWTGWLAVALAVGCILLFHFLPEPAGLSRGAMDFIGIGLAGVILWIVNIIPDYIVALGMAMLWVLFGIVKPESALSGFSSPTWLYMIFIMALSAVITKSGILYRLSLHALKRFPPHYRGQISGIVAGAIVLNPLIPSSSAKVSLGVPIARSLAESLGFKDNSRGAAGLGLTAMIFYGFTAPFVMTGSYTNVMAFGLATGHSTVSWLQWALYALPAFFVFAAVMLAVLGMMFKGVSTTKGISLKVLDEQLRLLGPLSSEERISIGTVVGCVLLMMLEPLHGIDSAWVMFAGFAVLVVSGVLDSRTLKSGIDWTFLLFLGVAFSFANAAGELGIADALSAFLGDHMGMFISSPMLFLAIVVLLSFAVTLVVRDDPAVILLVTALIPLADQAGIHPWIVVFVILLSTDPFFFSYQSPTYLTAYYSSEGKSFSHRQGRMVALGYALAVLAVTIVSVPYWKWLGLIH
ncbi:SLC13 family permease [Cohnella faecalis]|uniref:Sodium-dependent dicarboxylate transporter SdcS n=1 Tax=Cohnella faecalis TaxID=2315694 RepID=A0A398CWS7_9BACL|nr:SLC13 family permease [Cohnella faecalis]RIE03661.1 hypothetical protein D3H35_10195 [Cohnella faecalis]